jgi:hypothetical protein
VGDGSLCARGCSPRQAVPAVGDSVWLGLWAHTCYYAVNEDNDRMTQPRSNVA